jgi:hypothetical protein
LAAASLTVSGFAAAPVDHPVARSPFDARRTGLRGTLRRNGLIRATFVDARLTLAARKCVVDPRRTFALSLVAERILWLYAH